MRPTAALALAIVCLVELIPRGNATGDTQLPRPEFHAAARAVSTWRTEAADALVLTPDQVVALQGTGVAPPVARCVKLNNYWCIKKAGWNGELAADDDGHVAFASAVEGAAVAALLLKRYYVDFGRKTAMAIISHWAPAQCGISSDFLSARASAIAASRRWIARTTASKGIGGTLRARWLSTHPRGAVTPFAPGGGRVKQSVVADHVPRPMPAPTIAAGLGESKKPMTLDAMMMTSRNAPPSRSMIGLPRRRAGPGLKPRQMASISSCGSDSGRIASYAAKAAVGITPGADGDLGLFAPDGSPTKNLEVMMANMARVEIGPLGPKSSLIQAGITAAFRPGRNPPTP